MTGSSNLELLGSKAKSVPDKTAGTGRIKITDLISFLLGEPQKFELILTRVNWWQIGVATGLFQAVVHLILLTNPSICYLYAAGRVRGFEVTLPEAMASAGAWGWFGLLFTPFLLVSALAATAWFIGRIDQISGGSGNFKINLGMVTTVTVIITLGQITGLIIINAIHLKDLNDLRDLTPGVGLGLLPFFTVERIGPFFHEMVRGFDLFGIWTVLWGAALYQAIDHFSKVKSFMIAGIFYGIFIMLRWVAEGPGYWLWHYFWNAGN